MSFKYCSYQRTLWSLISDTIAVITISKTYTISFSLTAHKSCQSFLQVGFSSFSPGLPLIASRIYRNLCSEAKSMSHCCPYGNGQYNLTGNSFLIVYGNIWISDLTSSYTTSPYPCGNVFVPLWLRGPVFACWA